MGRQLESDLAWDLVEQNRDSLTDDERQSAFVHLGVGDYPQVLQCVLRAVAREQVALPTQTRARLQAWIALYDMGIEYRSLLSQVAVLPPSEDLTA